MQGIKIALDDLRCSSPPHQLRAADVLCVCSFQNYLLLITAGDRPLGWEYWADSQRHV